MAYEAPLGLPVLDDVQDEPSRHLDHLVAPGEAVMVVERLEVVKVGVSDAEGLVPVDKGLDRPVYRDIAGKARRGG